MPRVLILDNARLAAAARNREIVSRFPFISPAVVRSRPGCCGGGANQTDWGAVKAGIAGLSDGDVLILKRLLRTDRIAVYVVVDGRPERVER